MFLKKRDKCYTICDELTKNDLKNGFGILTWPDGERYEVNLRLIRGFGKTMI